MARLVLPLVILLLVILVTGWVIYHRSKKVTKGNTAKPLSAVSVHALTGDNLLNHTLYLLETYGTLAKEEFPETAKKLFFSLISTSKSIGERYSSGKIPAQAASDIKAILTDYLMSANEFFIRRKATDSGHTVISSYELMNRRLDEINQTLLYSDEHKIGVTNFYWESKIKHQPPQVDTDD